MRARLPELRGRRAHGATSARRSRRAGGGHRGAGVRLPLRPGSRRPRPRRPRRAADVHARGRSAPSGGPLYLAQTGHSGVPALGFRAASEPGLRRSRAGAATRRSVRGSPREEAQRPATSTAGRAELGTPRAVRGRRRRTSAPSEGSAGGHRVHTRPPGSVGSGPQSPAREVEHGGEALAAALEACDPATERGERLLLPRDRRDGAGRAPEPAGDRGARDAEAGCDRRVACLLNEPDEAMVVRALRTLGGHPASISPAQGAGGTSRRDGVRAGGSDRSLAELGAYAALRGRDSDRTGRDGTTPSPRVPLEEEVEEGVHGAARHLANHPDPGLGWVDVDEVAVEVRHLAVVARPVRDPGPRRLGAEVDLAAERLGLPVAARGDREDNLSPRPTSMTTATCLPFAGTWTCRTWPGATA